MKTHGAVSWTELQVNPTEPNTHAFYSAVFRWELKKIPMPDHEYNQLSIGEQPFGGVAPRENASSMWLNYITVNDVDVACAAAQENGGHVLVAPYDAPPGRIARISDPNGAEFFVIAYTA